MKGLIRKGKKFAFQAGIPKDVRHHFDGRQKHFKLFDTEDPIHAERLAAEADREFTSQILRYRQDALSGERLDEERRHQIAGWLFGQYYNQHEHDYFDLEESIKSKITEAYDDEFPLIQGLYTEGLVFDQIVKQVETMLEWAEGTGYARKQPAERPGSTMIGAYEIWAKSSRLIPKTVKQYGKSVRDFTEWFELSNGKCYGARVTRRHVNQFVMTRMQKNAAKASIMRDLAGLRLVYKAGQFGDSNPFSRVTDRMVLDGPVLKVRDFTDAEMQQLLRPGSDDWPAIMIAAYSGMRLSEITSLKRSNVEQVGTKYVFNLMNAGRRKTKAAYRKVPVHPVLWQKVIRSALERLKPNDSLIGPDTTDALSKRINRVIDSITVDPAVRAHSLRHTFITKLAEAGVNRELRMAIAGHEGSDAHDRYTHADFLIELSKQIGKVRYG